MLTSFKAVYFSCFSGRNWVILFSQKYIHTSPKSWWKHTVFQVQSTKHTASMGSKREFPDLLELAHLGIRWMLSAQSFCSLKSTCWSPNPQVTVFGGEVFGKSLGLDEDEYGDPTMGLVPWDQTSMLSPPHEDTVVSICVHLPRLIGVHRCP